MADELLEERQGDVLWLTLNRPDVHNALNAALTKALVAAFDAASTQTSLRAVVLTGAGTRTFCSGADLKESLGGMFRSDSGTNPIGDVLRAMERCGHPVIGRINGSALAGGIGLIAGCDLVYAADHARFGLPEVRVGIFPMMVAARLLDQIPRRRLQELAYLGETMDAAMAAECGLITSAVPADELDSRVADTLACLLRNSPAALSAGKRAMRQMTERVGEDRLRLAEDALASLSDGPDAIEGRAAFSQKRKPDWAR